MTNDNRKVALITGANKGLGFEVARQLGKRGMHVIIGARDESRGKAAVDKLQSQNIPATYLPLDVTDRESIKNAAVQVAKAWGKLDVLINNAGISAT